MSSETSDNSYKHLEEQMSNLVKLGKKRYKRRRSCKPGKSTETDYKETEELLKETRQLRKQLNEIKLAMASIIEDNKKE